MKLFRPKTGDTLIEVTLAVGIFSMVAVAVVSVINSNLSNAQVDLETTVTREQIDAQAEALRFIQNAHITNMNNEKTSVYDTLWDTITSNAIDTSVLDSKYNPTPRTCSEIYDGRLESLKAFVININNIGSDFVREVYISAVPNAGSKTNISFTAAATYPRLVYDDSLTGLISQDTGTDLVRVEGLYVVAVKDKNSTQIINGTTGKKTSAFYDFYISSCWYGPGSDTPSTISTMIRLYNPVVVK